MKADPHPYYYLTQTNVCNVAHQRYEHGVPSGVKLKERTIDEAVFLG